MAKADDKNKRRGLKTFFPYYGNKRRIIHEVWARFGAPTRVVEPFCGSMALLQGMPDAVTPKRFIMNDLDGFVVNFARCMKWHPEAMLEYLTEPVSELNLQAWNKYLIGARARLTDDLRSDPFYFEPRIAGVWAWGLCLFIGEGFASSNYKTRPKVANNQGLGSFRRDPEKMMAFLKAFQARLRGVDLLCRDWSGLVTNGVTAPTMSPVIAVFLDPPYDPKMRDRCYAVERNVSADVRAWCCGMGSDPQYRIALCGLRGEHDELEGLGWKALYWSTTGGMSKSAKGLSRGKKNSKGEVIWFSPACLDPESGQSSIV